GTIVTVSVFAVLKFRKQGYTMPILRMETLGIRRGLTAVEASHLLGLPPAKIVAEILFSLLMKKVIWVKSTDPVMKIKVVKPLGDDAGKVDSRLRYYELTFIKASKKDGTLDEVKLAEALMLLRDTVKAKLHGYCRQDTIAYYTEIVAKAWNQVEEAGAPELTSKAYDENLLWLLLDKNIQSETTRVFKDQNFTPGPDWWWYWYIYRHSLPRPEAKPPTGPPTGKSTPPTIPGADFANNVVISIERASNNIVNNIEKFTNSILPPPPPAKRVSSKPARRGASCVCACASCACACACVSCACACASGGVG
ncbi:MAG: hypothetical protein NWE97_03110, partial [Candidatus Bathyarchaeota archaeon]|nr:hypothetical protein [Candidatus Bathyarchaeota archaeon]